MDKKQTEFVFELYFNESSRPYKDLFRISAINYESAVNAAYSEAERLFECLPGFEPWRIYVCEVEECGDDES